MRYWWLHWSISNEDSQFIELIVNLSCLSELNTFYEKTCKKSSPRDVDSKLINRYYTRSTTHSGRINGITLNYGRKNAFCRYGNSICEHGKTIINTIDINFQKKQRIYVQRKSVNVREYFAQKHESSNAVPCRKHNSSLLFRGSIRI